MQSKTISATPDIEAWPATSGRWRDLERVMMECANARKCWCAFWYLPNREYLAGWGTANKRVLEDRVKRGELPGIIAYSGADPVAWVSVAPRRVFDRLNRSKNFTPLDDLDVWAINCFVVAKTFRRRGLMPRLIELAARFAFSQGAPAVEGYPVAPGEKSGSADLYLGTEKAFLRAGFHEVARPLPRRPMMRLTPEMFTND